MHVKRCALARTRAHIFVPAHVNLWMVSFSLEGAFFKRPEFELFFLLLLRVTNKKGARRCVWRVQTSSESFFFFWCSVMLWRSPCRIVSNLTASPPRFTLGADGDVNIEYCCGRCEWRLGGGSAGDGWRAERRVLHQWPIVLCCTVAQIRNSVQIRR